MFARFMIFFFGLCVLSLGIATVTNAGLGTGTVSSVAQWSFLFFDQRVFLCSASHC